MMMTDKTMQGMEALVVDGAHVEQKEGEDRDLNLLRVPLNLHRLLWGPLCLPPLLPAGTIPLETQCQSIPQRGDGLIVRIL